jgi:hypothetical protein
MDRHFCDSYANAFAVSNSNGYPKPKRHANCYGNRLCFGDCHRQSKPIGDNYAFAVSNFHTSTYRDTGIPQPEPFFQTNQSLFARDAASTSRANSGRLGRPELA